jgi:hypothetical protein
MSCAICNEKVSSREPKLCKCSYNFHVKCLRKWYNHSQKNFNKINCPCCKRKIQIWKNTRSGKERKKILVKTKTKLDDVLQCNNYGLEYEKKIIDLFEFIWEKRIYIRKEKGFYNCCRNKLDEMKDTKRFRKTYSKMKNL